MATGNVIQRFAVIGLGRFGSRLAANLTAARQEVIAIDKSIKVIEKIRDRVTLAVALDATDEQALRAQAIDKVDAAIVGIGDHFQSRVLATVILKKLGVPKIISRAAIPAEAQVMKCVGADEVVNPEDESADRWAVSLANPWFLSCFELDSDYNIVEINPPQRWVGKTLAELQLRKNFGVHIVAIRVGGGDLPTTATGRRRLQIPLPDQPLGAQDVLVMMGRDEALAGVRDE